MNFSDALNLIKCGRRLARRHWNGRGIFIAMQYPDPHSKMSSPYIYIDTTGLQSDDMLAPRSRVPWVCSQTDMMADDWVCVDE
jgi:hypothetical protein